MRGNSRHTPPKAAEALMVEQREEKKRWQAAQRQKRHRGKLDEQVRNQWRRFHHNIWNQLGQRYIADESPFDYHFNQALYACGLADKKITGISQLSWLDWTPEASLSHSRFTIRLESSEVLLSNLLCVNAAAIFTYTLEGQAEDPRIHLIKLHASSVWAPYKGRFRLPEEIEIVMEKKAIWDEKEQDILMVFLDEVAHLHGFEAVICKDERKRYVVLAPLEEENRDKE